MLFDPEKITFFAKTDARGKDVMFGIKAKDRQRHMYVVGKTGMGKSTLLENMAVQDIQNGEGMAFIDPHGSAAEVLLKYVPEHRVNDVVYFAPFDLDNPISFNVMEDVGQDKRHLVVSGLMSTFKKIWVDAWSARMEYILTNALLVLIEYPDTTLLSVNRIFNDKAYRLKVVDYCTDPAVKSFWVDEFANYTERFAAEALPAIQNKIGQFTGNPLIRNIIGQPHSSFDFREMMDQQKIVIMNLSKGLIGETNANLLGSMLTTRIYLAAMSRANLPVAEMKKMPNFYFYVDEFQSFANATFANILSEARKYHLNLIIAHQYIEQMEEEVRDAVFGNVGTTVTFRVGPFDAETLETVFTPRFLAADLVNLGFAQIYLTLMIDGIGSQPFSAVTLPPIEPPRVSCENMVIAASRRNYTKPRDVVEKLVTELHTPPKPEPSANSKLSGGQNSGQKSSGSNSSSTQKYPPKRDEKPLVKVAQAPRPVSDTPPAAPEASPSTPEILVKTQEPVLPPVTVPTPPIKTEPATETRRENQSRSGDSQPKRLERKSPPAQIPKPLVSTQNTEDLRAILATIAANNKTTNQSTDVTVSKRSGNIADGPSLKAALASALKTVPEPAPARTAVTASSKNTPSSFTPASVTNSSAAPEPDHKADMAALAAEAEAAFAALEQGVEKPQTKNMPDPRQLQKILKTPHGGRSPFK